VSEGDLSNFQLDNKREKAAADDISNPVGWRPSLRAASVRTPTRHQVGCKTGAVSTKGSRAQRGEHRHAAEEGIDSGEAFAVQSSLHARAQDGTATFSGLERRIGRRTSMDLEHVIVSPRTPSCRWSTLLVLSGLVINTIYGISRTEGIVGTGAEGWVYKSGYDATCRAVSLPNRSMSTKSAPNTTPSQAIPQAHLTIQLDVHKHKHRSCPTTAP
jgi:hypothetical protein